MIGTPGSSCGIGVVGKKQEEGIEMASADREAIEQRVKEIVGEHLGVEQEEVRPDARFIEDLGADSLDIVELVMALEEEYEVEVPDEEAEKLRTVGDVMAYIESQRK